MLGTDERIIKYERDFCFRHRYLNPSNTSGNILLKLNFSSSLFVPAYSRLIGIKQSTVLMYRKASIAKFQKNPKLETINPPTKGPIMRVPGIVNTLVANALLISLSGTVLATNALLTGILIDSQEPAIKAYRYTCHISMMFIWIRTAKIKASNAIKTSIAITNFLLSRRSPRTPPNGPIKTPGSATAPPIPTTRRAEFEASSDKNFTNHPRVNSCSQCAVLEQKLANHKNL